MYKHIFFLCSPRKRVHEINPWPLASGTLAIEGKTIKRLSGPGPGDLCDEGPCYQKTPPPRPVCGVILGGGKGKKAVRPEEMQLMQKM